MKRLPRNAIITAILAGIRDDCAYDRRPVLADALEDAGYDDAESLAYLRSPEPTDNYRYGDWLASVTVPNQIQGCDWKEALDVATLGPARPGSDIALDPFTLADVDEVLAAEEGENDGANWLCVGRLFDGRWFFLTAGCDYTGWG